MLDILPDLDQNRIPLHIRHGHGAGDDDRSVQESLQSLPVPPSTTTRSSVSSRVSSGLSSVNQQYDYYSTLVASGVRLQISRARLPRGNLAREAADDMLSEVETRPETRLLVAAAEQIMNNDLDPGPSASRNMYATALANAHAHAQHPYPDPFSAEQLLALAHRFSASISDFPHVFRREAAYQTAIEALVQGMLAIPTYLKRQLAAAPHQPTSDRLLDALALSSLIPVKPDYAVGLDKESILVRQSARHPAESSRQLLVEAYPYVASSTTTTSVLLDAYFRGRRGVKGDQIYVANHAEFDQRDCFEFLFFELKPISGDPGKALLQNTTAMRVALDVISNLARAAYEADPDGFMQPDKEMATVWGVRSCAVDVELWVMAYEGGEYTTTRVTQLTLDDPAGLSTLLSFIDVITGRAERRRELIGNWLWCLRNCSHIGSAKRSATVKAGRKRKSRSPGKHRREREEEANTEISRSRPANDRGGPPMEMDRTSGGEVDAEGTRDTSSSASGSSIHTPVEITMLGEPGLRPVKQVDQQQRIQGWRWSVLGMTGEGSR